MDSQSSPFSGWIESEIHNHGPITIAQFIEWALYHPQYGYYTRGPNIGPKGDFTTSPEASPEFGRMLARHLVDVDDLLGNPQNFDVVEFGPGRGTLAHDILAELSVRAPGLYSRLCYHLIAISPALAEEQKLALLPTHSGRVRWSLSIEHEHNLCGAIIANEFLDAFPVHVIEMHKGVLAEQYVHIGENGLRITRGPLSSPELLDFLERSKVHLEEGEKIEVNLAMLEWAAQAGRAFTSCIALVIDYGDVAPGRYSSQRREGTLLGYYGGSVTADILAHPGEQDLTALVDFTALQDDAVASGFEILGMARQASFLVGLGLGSGEPQPHGDNLDVVLRQKRGVQTILSMEGLGRFHVLVLSKGLDAQKARGVLTGLRYADVL